MRNNKRNRLISWTQRIRHQRISHSVLIKSEKVNCTSCGEACRQPCEMWKKPKAIAIQRIEEGFMGLFDVRLVELLECDDTHWVIAMDESTIKREQFDVDFNRNFFAFGFSESMRPALMCFFDWHWIEMIACGCNYRVLKETNFYELFGSK